MKRKKKNKFLGTYIVVGIVVLLGIYVYQSEKGGHVDRAAVRIFEANTDDISAIELTDNEAGKVITLQKKGKDWKMVKPGDYELDKVAVEGLVNSLANLPIERKVKDNIAELSAYGLDKPAYKAAFTEKGKVKAYIIGKKNPTEVSYYIMDEAGKDLYTAFNYSVDNLKKDLKSLRKKYLTELDPEKLTGITIKMDTGVIVLMKSKDKWWISPYNFECDEKAMGSLMGRIKNIRVVDYIDDEPKSLIRYGLESPRVSLCADSGTSKVTVLVGKKVADKEEDYVKVEGQASIYSVDRSFTQSLDKTYNDFRSRNVLSFKPDEISAIDFDKGGKKIPIIKDKSGKFTLDKPFNKPADIQVRDLISHLGSLQAQRFADDSGKRLEKYGLKNPIATVSLFTKSGNEKKLKARLLIGTSEKSEMFVMIEGQNSVFADQKVLLDKLIGLESIAGAN